MERPSIGPIMVYVMELPSGLKYILLLRLLLHEEAYKRSVGRVVNDVNVLGITILGKQLIVLPFLCRAAFV